MDPIVFWWLAAAGLIIAELLTGTIYLLAIASGAVAGAIAAHIGTSMTTQTSVAAVVSIAATLLWHFRKRSDQHRHPTPVQSNPDLNQDIGAQVQVDAWNSDGTAQIQYRGAQWTVIAAADSTPKTGLHRVTQVIGSRLVVQPL